MSLECTFSGRSVNRMCKKILSAEKNNTGRQYEYDLAKAISLFFMIIESIPKFV